MAIWNFRYLSSYGGETDYEAVSSNGQAGRVSFRFNHVEYFRETYNGGHEAYDREVGPTLHALRWASSPEREVSQEMVDAFNAWRISRNKEFLAMIKSNPAKYGDLPDNDPLLTPVVIAKRIRWDQDAKGWCTIAA